MGEGEGVGLAEIIDLEGKRMRISKEEEEDNGPLHR